MQGRVPRGRDEDVVRGAVDNGFDAGRVRGEDSLFICGEINPHKSLASKPLLRSLRLTSSRPSRHLRCMQRYHLPRNTHREQGHDARLCSTGVLQVPTYRTSRHVCPMRRREVATKWVQIGWRRWHRWVDWRAQNMLYSFSYK